MKQPNFARSFALSSAFAVTLGTLPLLATSADAATMRMATAQPVAMSTATKSEGNCSQKMGKGSQEGNCSKGGMKTKEGEHVKSHMKRQ